MKLGNGRKLSVEGKGNIKLKIEGRIQVISGVYYILTKEAEGNF